jgi:hypothetical protein
MLDMTDALLAAPTDKQEWPRVGLKAFGLDNTQPCFLEHQADLL